MVFDQLISTKQLLKMDQRVEFSLSADKKWLLLNAIFNAAKWLNPPISMCEMMLDFSSWNVASSCPVFKPGAHSHLLVPSPFCKFSTGYLTS